MAKYRKKIVVEATQWFKNGNHPQVKEYEHPNLGGMSICRECRDTFNNHGWIDTHWEGHIVCPGDWIIKGVIGEFYPCKPDIFKATYEKTSDQETI